jgi:pyridoxine/pyridoxamine 5'-phosphate oxidase
MRQIQLVVTSRPLSEIPEEEDFNYWLSRPVVERLQAVTQIVSQSVKPGQRLDKTVVLTRKLKAF